MSTEFKCKKNRKRLIYHPTEYVDIITAQIWKKEELKELNYKIVERKQFIDNRHVYAQTFVKIIGKQLTLF